MSKRARNEGIRWRATLAAGLPPLALLLAAPAEAAIYTVDTLADGPSDSECDNDCTLREAAGLAFGTPGADQIQFIPTLTGSIEITGPIPLGGEIDLLGSGSERLTIDGGDQFRAFNVYAGSDVLIDGMRIYEPVVGIYSSGADLELRDLVFEGGYSTGLGTVWVNDGGLTMSDSVMEDNVNSSRGGGIRGSEATVTIESSRFEGNRTLANDGGAISLTGSGSSLDVSGSEFVSNSAPGRGGAIDATLASISGSSFTGNTAATGGAISGVGDLTISASLFSENVADPPVTDSRGGAIEITSGDLEIYGSTIEGNIAETQGGGIFQSGGGEVRIENSTITGNLVRRAVGGYGAGAYLTPGLMRIEGTTIAGNTINPAAPASDGAGLAINTGGNLEISGSLLADNTGGTDPDLALRGAGTVTVTDSLVEDGSGSVTEQGAVIRGQDPGLGPLAANGGPTPTMAIGQSSPALDAVSGPGSLETDQRGVARPQFAAPDMGAFELEPDPADPQCSDGGDNDGDGKTDFPADPGCSSVSDDDETDPFEPPDPDTEVSDPDATAKKKQKQKGKRIKVKIKAGAQEQVTGVARGRVTVKGSKRKFGLEKVTKKTEAGEQAVYRLVPKRKRDNKKILRLLKKGKDLRANPSVKLTDLAGNSVTEKRVVRLR